MSGLSYKQEVEILEHVAEGLITEGDWQLFVNESIDGLIPVYYTELIAEWVEAGAPQPDDNHGDIFQQMALGLWELMDAFIYDLLSEATDSPSARDIVQKELGVRHGYLGLAKAVLQ